MPYINCRNKYSKEIETLEYSKYSDNNFKQLLSEYRLSDNDNHYYISGRCTNDYYIKEMNYLYDTKGITIFINSKLKFSKNKLLINKKILLETIDQAEIQIALLKNAIKNTKNLINGSK